RRDGCGQPRNDRAPRWGRVPAQRPEDLDQSRRPRGHLPGLRHRRPLEGLAGRHGVRRRARDGRPDHWHAPWQARDPRRAQRAGQPRPRPRAGNTGLINLADVPVPAENRIGEEGEGFLIAMSAIDQGRYTVAAGAVGLAQACINASVKYAHERRTFGEEIGHHQLVKQLIAKMVAGTEMGRLLVWRAGWLKNQGKRNTRETSLAKWHATEHSV